MKTQEKFKYSRKTTAFFHIFSIKSKVSFEHWFLCELEKCTQFK